MGLVYDGANNIVQTIAVRDVASNEGLGVVVSPLTNAAINGFADATGAPNAFTSTGGPTSKTISTFGTNGSGQYCFNMLNPA
jgi:hypothetical protein